MTTKGTRSPRTKAGAEPPAEKKLTAEEKAELAKLPADVQQGVARHRDDPVSYTPEEAVAVAQKRTSEWATPVKRTDDEGE